jgi:hypothetical protein
MALNALCWECFLSWLGLRRLPRALIRADVLVEIYWPDCGLLGVYGWSSYNRWPRNG